MPRLSNAAASLEPGEPATVAGEPAGASVWYRWTAPTAGQGRMDTISSNFDTLLGIYTGAPETVALSTFRVCQTNALGWFARRRCASLVTAALSPAEKVGEASVGYL